jgi:hypothetical protein
MNYFGVEKHRKICVSVVEILCVRTIKHSKT